MRLTVERLEERELLTNNSPTGLLDAFTLHHDQPFHFVEADLLANDPPDLDSDPLSVSIISGVINGSVTSDPLGGWIFTPSVNFFGFASAKYQSFDQTDLSDPIDITFTVLNDAPIASATPLTLVKGESFNGLFGAFTDSDDTTGFTASIDFGDTLIGAASITANTIGGFDVTAVHAYVSSGTYTAMVTVTDRLGASSSFSVGVLVHPTTADLYANYEMAVAAADLVFQGAIDAANSQFDALQNSSNAGQNATADSADQTYESAIENSLQVYWTAVETAEGDYEVAANDADQIRGDRVDAAVVARDSAVATATSAGLTGDALASEIATAELALLTEIDAAEAAYVAAEQAARGIADVAENDARAAQKLAELAAWNANEDQWEDVETDSSDALMSTVSLSNTAIDAATLVWRNAEDPAWAIYIAAITSHPSAPVAGVRIFEPRPIAAPTIAPTTTSVGDPPTTGSVQYFPLASTLVIGQDPGTSATSPPPTTVTPPPVWVRPASWHLPKNGVWQNPLQMGNCNFLLTTPIVVGTVTVTQVTFVNGLPDFSPWAVANFHVSGLNGNHGHDRRLILVEVAHRNNLGSSAEAERWLKNQGLHSHHADANGRILLVPADIHKNVRHSGGAALMGARNLSAQVTRRAIRGAGIVLSAAVIWHLLENSAQAAAPTGPATGTGSTPDWWQNGVSAVSIGNTVLATTTAGSEVLQAGTSGLGGTLRTLSQPVRATGATRTAAQLRATGASLSRYSRLLDATNKVLGRVAGPVSIGVGGLDAANSAWNAVANGDVAGWNGFVSAQQNGINDVIFFYVGGRWQGVLHNPIISGAGAFFNPIGTLIGTAANVTTIGNEIDAIRTIYNTGSRTNEAISRNFDNIVAERTQYYNSSANTAWIQTTAVPDLVVERDNLIASLQARQAFLTWGETQVNRWWWNRSVGKDRLNADISRTRIQLQLYQRQIARLNAEIARRSGTLLNA